MLFDVAAVSTCLTSTNEMGFPCIISNNFHTLLLQLLYCDAICLAGFSSAAAVSHMRQKLAVLEFSDPTKEAKLSEAVVGRYVLTRTHVQVAAASCCVC